MPPSASLEPLIVTLGLDDTTFGVLDGLRRRHFPPERNWLAAHVTLFHKLPGDRLQDVQGHLADVARRVRTFAVVFGRPVSLGRGVAIAVDAPALMALRARLAAAFSPWLTPQDRQRFRPHVTLQNKVLPSEAGALYASLCQTWRPLAGEGRSLLLWRYLGGPWAPVADFPFSGTEPETP